MNPNDDALPSYLLTDAVSAYEAVAGQLEHIRAQLVMAAGDPDGQLRQFARMLSLKRGCHR